jgi:hypothetical protein
VNLTDKDKGILVWAGIIVAIFVYSCYVIPGLAWFFIACFAFFGFFGLIGGNR